MRSVTTRQSRRCSSVAIPPCGHRKSPRLARSPIWKLCSTKQMRCWPSFPRRSCTPFSATPSAFTASSRVRASSRAAIARYDAATDTMDLELTGQGLHGIRRQLAELGVTHLIPKPFGMAEIAAALNAMGVGPR